MDKLKEILNRVLQSTPKYEESKKRIHIYELWPKVVGERVAQHCWPVKLFDDGTLLIAAQSNVWLQSLRFLEQQIIEKYQKELKTKEVKQLRFKLQMKADADFSQ